MYWISNLLLKSGPNGAHPFRTLGLGQRPFIDSSFTSHLRDLETFRRKVPPLTAIQPTANVNTTVHSTTNSLIGSSDCQGYKPNAPQIQGKQYLNLLLRFKGIAWFCSADKYRGNFKIWRKWRMKLIRRRIRVYYCTKYPKNSLSVWWKLMCLHFCYMKRIS